ncbi:sensor histidine kinase [Streptococcus mutans]|uniref:sensor histidine kinase n=1 Tax=Streptococcus mutans TaxID=1309 RepID=UPI0002B5FBC2|nr:ATP-binding protein [Streptococcus mutans]EMC04492.1 Two-component system sensor histidine kinase [Streptococcus mutans NLML5]EMC56696.1 Two-component system sensor histidine kinase [Streptococcus mutans OMZ175]EMP69252.1 putative two-component system sensor histidine kinase [Streptococcus mutans NCTC 11060]NLQ33241.1 histidine kinase [Streptococcus mutans]QZS44195.1 PDZ domain-containing protein [Streptococcus mutans OMZ175]
MRKEVKIRLLAVVVMSASFILLSLYFYNFVNKNTYLGIKVSETGAHIERIYVGGAAEAEGLKVGDQLLSIDGVPASQNILLNKWLIVEQAKKLTIKREGKLKKLTIVDNGNMTPHFIHLLLASFLFFIFFVDFLRKNTLYPSNLYFICFGLSLSLISLAAIPSSMGDNFGRGIVFSFLVVTPLFAHYFAFNLGLEALGSEGKRLYHLSRVVLSLVAGICILISVVYTFFFKSPLFASTFVPLLFYYLGISLVVITAFFTWGVRKKISNPISKLNFPLIILLSFVPFFFFYLFPTPWESPYSVVIPFCLLPVASMFYLLVLSRTVSYKIRRFRILMAIFIAVVTTFLGFLSHFIPSVFIFGYAYFLFYSLFPLIEELFILSNWLPFSRKEVSIFVAMEREREDIALLLHDTIIQDIIFEMKNIETNNHNLDKKEILNLLEGNVYQLRELCSSIYPLLIREKGLEKAINSALDKVRQSQLVEIDISFPKEEISLTERENNFVLRTLLELVNNSIKHGKATQIIIKIKNSVNNITFSVKDNGKYIIPSEDGNKHFGLELIKEKLLLIGGNLIIDLSDGTTIMFVVPKVK